MMGRNRGNPGVPKAQGTDVTAASEFCRACFELIETADERPSPCDWVDAVEARAVRMGLSSGLDGDAVYYLGVALREAMVNALRHGRRRDGRAWVTVGLRLLRSGRLVMTVRDRGRGFDPGTVPDPCSPENARRSCGRGLFYMRQFVDRLSFSFPRRGGALVRLEKRLPSGGWRH
jgi:serine/threonine-protein kinase RsbW